MWLNIPGDEKNMWKTKIETVHDRRQDQKEKLRKEEKEMYSGECQLHSRNSINICELKE